MIIQPIDMNFSDKKFSMIIYGSPGLGKTTLALSAPTPLLLDFDRGVSRVKAYHRKDTAFCENYEDVLNDLSCPDTKKYETIIIDTGGSFVTYLQDWAMRTNPTVNKQKNGAISLKGFGAVKSEFIRITNHIRDVMNKNVIYVFHSTEEKDKDGNQLQRLQCEGAARNLVWQPCDIGCYMQMMGTKRYVSFTPEEDFFAKGCYGIEGRHEVPFLKPTDKNDFLTRLFEEAKNNITTESEAFAPLKIKYDNAMQQAKRIIDAIKSPEDINKAVSLLPALDHELTSKKESSVLLNEKAVSFGLVWNKTSGTYIPKEDKQ